MSSWRGDSQVSGSMGTRQGRGYKSDQLSLSNSCLEELALVYQAFSFRPSTSSEIMMWRLILLFLFVCFPLGPFTFLSIHLISCCLFVCLAGQPQVA